MGVTDEPIYIYKKGEGWVIEPTYKSISREITKNGVTYLVTVYNRPPRPGERGTRRVRLFNRPSDIPSSLIFYNGPELFGFLCTTDNTNRRAKTVVTVRL